MPVPAIVVDIAPDPVPPEMAATLIAACSEAVHRGSCVLLESTRAPRRPRAFVRVTWQQPEQQQAELQVIIHGADRAQGVFRTLTFGSADALVERWRAVGFSIGALVGAEEAAQAERAAPGATSAAAQPLPQTEPDVDGAAAGAESRSGRVWAGLGALTGPGLGSGTWRFGGWLRAEYSFETIPLLVSLTGSYAASPEDNRRLNANWLAFGAGGGVYLTAPTAGLEFRLRAEVRAERLGVWTRDETSGLEDGGSRWAVGPQLGVHITWPYDSVIAGVAGVSGWTLNDDTVIAVRAQQVASAPWAGVGFELGLRLAAP